MARYLLRTRAAHHAGPQSTSTRTRCSAATPCTRRRIDNNGATWSERKTERAAIPRIYSIGFPVRTRRLATLPGRGRVGGTGETIGIATPMETVRLTRVACMQDTANQKTLPLVHAELADRTAEAHPEGSLRAILRRRYSNMEMA
eukprot:8985274-Pyramimonas_sp.AAC.1